MAGGLKTMHYTLTATESRTAASAAVLALPPPLPAPRTTIPKKPFEDHPSPGMHCHIQSQAHLTTIHRHQLRARRICLGREPGLKAPGYNYQEFEGELLLHFTQEIGLCRSLR